MSRFQSLGRLRLWVLLLATVLTGCAGVRQIDTGVTGDATAQLFVPYQFAIQAIDSTTLRDSFYTFDGRDQTLRVAPGEHELTLRYYDMIETTDDRTDDYEKVLSEPITVRFTAEANGQYAVVGERPMTPQAGTAYAADPELVIENRASGATVSDAITVAEPEVQTIRRGSTVYAPVGQTGAATSNTAAAEAGPAPAPASGPPQSVEMLKYWWNNATADERARFEAWRRDAAD